MDMTCWTQERLAPPHLLGVFPPHTLSGAEPWALPPPYTSFLSCCLLSILPSISLAVPWSFTGSACLLLPLSFIVICLAVFDFFRSMPLFPASPFPALSASLAPSISSYQSLPPQTHWTPLGCLAKPALTPCLVAFPLPDRAGGHPGIHGGGHVSRGPTVGGRVGGAADLPAGELGRGSCFPQTLRIRQCLFIPSFSSHPGPEGGREESRPHSKSGREGATAQSP